LWVTDEGAWSGPAALTGNGFAPPGAAVAAAHQTSMHQLDAFVVDVNGALNVLWVTDEGAWSGPAAL
ncbi:MAG: hypothetical protein M3256_22050, partial [Actinomycetota bacterium]|nr:hypothetical protein [Actinomycetota bacterium]